MWPQQGRREVPERTAQRCLQGKTWKARFSGLCWGFAVLSTCPGTGARDAGGSVWRVCVGEVILTCGDGPVLIWNCCTRDCALELVAKSCICSGRMRGHQQRSQLWTLGL